MYMATLFEKKKLYALGIVNNVRLNFYYVNTLLTFFERALKTFFFTSKPATYDGTTYWLDYKSHFEKCAQLGKWNETEKVCTFLYLWEEVLNEFWKICLTVDKWILRSCHLGDLKNPKSNCNMDEQGIVNITVKTNSNNKICKKKGKQMQRIYKRTNDTLHLFSFFFLQILLIEFVLTVIFTTPCSSMLQFCILF